MAGASSLILALDIGTSSSRTALFTSDGQRLLETMAQQKYPLATTSDGGAELDPAELLKAIDACLESTFARYRQDPGLQGRAIEAVGVSCFWHSLIGTDTAGRPLTRIITWADARCREDAAELRRELGEKATHARTGCMLRASFWPAKLVWLRRTEPALFRRVRRWMSPAEWLQRQFCDQANCALGMATGTGLFDPTKLAWDQILLDRCAIEPEQLGTVSDEPSAVATKVHERFPELASARWFPGIGDGAASNLGSGATRPGIAAINFGTSGALRVMREGKKARAPFGLFCYRVDAERFLVGGAVSNAGNLREWCLRELQVEPDPAALEQQLSTRPGPVADLTVLPSWTAERAPTWNEALRGAILGLTPHTTALDLLQAITDATYHRLASIAALVLAQEPAPPKFLVSGGVQHSLGAMQRLADVLNQPIYANPEPEASIRGAAVYAIEKLGRQPAAMKLPRPIRPRKKWAAAFAEQRARQEGLEQLLARA